MDTIRRINRRALFRLALLAALTLPGAVPGALAAAKAASKATPKPPAKALASPQAALKPFKEATFLLPAGSKVSSRWVLPPTEKTQLSATLSVGAEGSPLIGNGDGTLIAPDREFMIAVAPKPSAFAHLANGVLVLAVGKDLGLLAEPKDKTTDKKGVPIVGFQPLVALPVNKIDVLAAAGQAVYGAGLNPQTGRHALYRLRVVKGGGLQDLELIYESSQAITAVTADDETVFVAVGPSVVGVSRQDGSVSPIYTHPSATVNGLAATAGGLMVSTGSELVLAGKNGALEIMRSTGHRIAMQGGSLFILFQRSLGVLALGNLANLARFNLAVRPLGGDEAPSPLTITGVHFFDLTLDRPNLTDSFDRASVRRIVAQVDYRFPPAAKGTRRHTATVSWHEPTGGLLLSTAVPVVLPPRVSSGVVAAVIGEEPGRGGYLPQRKSPDRSIYRFGKDALGVRYPGQYRVLIQVDGIPAGEGTFYLVGPAKPFEAIVYDDMSMLQTLLGQGLSPRHKDEDGDPLLHLAVRFGSTRAVELLLKAGADPNATDKDGTPALSLLSTLFTPSDWQGKAELLIRHGANVNAVVGKDRVPLAISASLNPAYMTFLVNRGADIFAPHPLTKETLLGMVATGYRMCTDDLVSALLQRGANLNAYGKDLGGIAGLDNYTVLGNAIRFAEPDCVDLLLRKGASPTVVQRVPNGPARSALAAALETLHYGAAGGETDRLDAKRQVVRLLLNKGAALKPGEGFFMFRGEGPSYFDQAAMTRMLEQDDSALQEATRSGDPAIQELALRGHLGRIRKRTLAAGSESELKDAYAHCRQAFKLAEARYPTRQLDVLPDIQPSLQGAPGKPFLGIHLLKRDEAGAYVQKLEAGAAAARAGLRAGDIVLAMDTRKIAVAADVAATVSGLAPGVPVRITFRRDDPLQFPDLLLSCGVLEKELKEHALAEMNLSRWLSAHPESASAAPVRALLGEATR